MSDKSKTYYTIVYKPLTSKVWTPVSEDVDERLGLECTPWMTDLLLARKRCQHFNAIGIQRWLAGAKQWDRLVFRVATVTVADAEEIPQPKGDSVEY